MDPTELPGPAGQDIDLHAQLPGPAEVGEDPDTLAATHGDFHHRPGFRAGMPVLYCPCEDPMGHPEPACPVHGGA